MCILKKIILVLLCFFPISYSLGAMVTEVDDQQIVFEDLKNKIVIFFMKSIIIFILAFLIFNLTFVKEGHAAALASGDNATPYFVQNFDVSGQESKSRALPLIMMDQKCILLERMAMM